MPSLIILILITFWASSVVAIDRAIVLQTERQSQHNDEAQNTPDNLAVKTLHCIFEHSKQPFKVEHVPRKRSQIMLQKQQTDGLFLSSPLEQLDLFAQASLPLWLERWVVFSRKGSDSFDPSLHLVGVLLGSNEANWAIAEGWQIFESPTAADTLISMLNARRLDYIFLDKAIFTNIIKQKQSSKQEYIEHYFKYSPLSVYFSRKILSEDSDFMNFFNDSIGKCTKTTWPIHDDEALILQNRAKAIWQTPNLSVLVQSALSANPHTAHPEATLLREDAQWIEAVAQSSRTSLSQALLVNPLSQALRSISHLSNGQITEIFVFDARGFLVGLDRLTSDFWQGDEAPYQAVITNKAPLHISDIYFDRSTRQFGVQVSLPISGPDGIVGGLTIGFDIEQVRQTLY